MLRSEFSCLVDTPIWRHVEFYLTLRSWEEKSFRFLLKFMFKHEISFSKLPCTCKVTQLWVQVPCGKQKNNTELRVLPCQVGRSGNLTFSRIRSTHLPQSSPPHRPQQIIQRKPFIVRLWEDFDRVSLVETHTRRTLMIGGQVYTVRFSYIQEQA